jgi:putative colanic acid biosynthesis acetyltransferase WcaF
MDTKQVTRLDQFSNREYQPGSIFRRAAWYVCSLLFFEHGIFPFYGLKRGLLRLFGAQVGHGVLVKPSVKIKYPWFLTIGQHCWIGERVWIDNVAQVDIGNHVCISQGAMLLTGNHDYSSPVFTLTARPIMIEDGVWIGAMAVVCPGVVCHSHAVLGVGSVATKHWTHIRYIWVTLLS